MITKQMREGLSIARDKVNALVSQSVADSEADKVMRYYTVIEAWDSVNALMGWYRLSKSIIWTLIANHIGFSNGTSVQRIIYSYTMYQNGQKPEKKSEHGSYYRTWEIIFEKMQKAKQAGTTPKGNMPPRYYRDWNNLNKNHKAA